ncbi:MAG: ABC transporter ATP-binding protein [Anaerofustis sp.]
MEILNVSHVSKTIKKREIIKDISFSINEGEIVGFVGPNGAGKTTTMKLITNLISCDAGNITVCGHDLEAERENALECLSAIVETPGLYANLSGKDNVEFFRKLRNVDKKEADRLIETLGMKERITDKVKKYSLGMKQRLALIICLLSNPKLLILDEPTNGLDPTGTIELRNIIYEQAHHQQMAVLISSHILDELEKICDRIIFIKDGEIVSAKSCERSDVQVIQLKVDEPELAVKILDGCDYVRRCKVHDGGLIVEIDQDRLNDLIVRLTSQAVTLRHIETVQSLEQDYIDLFGVE